MKQETKNISKQVAIEAFERGREMVGNAPIHFHCAFANAVSYGMTGTPGSYEGPNLRQVLAMKMIDQKIAIGETALEEVMSFVKEFCYGKITLQHAIVTLEIETVGDYSGDLQQVDLLLSAVPQ